MVSALYFAIDMYCMVIIACGILIWNMLIYIYIYIIAMERARKKINSFYIAKRCFRVIRRFFDEVFVSFRGIGRFFDEVFASFHCQTSFFRVAKKRGWQWKLAKDRVEKPPDHKETHKRPRRKIVGSQGNIASWWKNFRFIHVWMGNPSTDVTLLPLLTTHSLYWIALVSDAMQQCIDRLFRPLTLSTHDVRNM